MEYQFDEEFFDFALLSRKPTIRALRRHHIARLKKNRRFYWGRDLMREHAKLQRSVVNTPCLCSCWTCGNRRKHFGKKTIQELRNLQRELL
jgi:hypothetical protein